MLKNEIINLNKKSLVKRQIEIIELEKFKIFLVDNIKVLKSLKSDSVSMKKFNDLLYDKLNMSFYYDNSNYSEDLYILYHMIREKNINYRGENYQQKYFFKQWYWKMHVYINRTNRGDWIEKTFLNSINQYINYKKTEIEQIKYTNKNITSILNKYKKIITIKKELQDNKLFYYESKEYIKKKLYDYHYLRY